MRVNGIPRRTIWLGADGASVEIIDQTRLPHEFAIARLRTLDEAAHAIRAMLVRRPRARCHAIRAAAMGFLARPRFPEPTCQARNAAVRLRKR